MKRNLFLLALAAALPLAACQEEPGTGPDRAGSPQFRSESFSDAAGRITALNWNIYVGTDVDVVIGALVSPDPGDDLPALINAIETLGRTDFTARAAAIADQIERLRPHVVGLQEVSHIDIDLTPLGLPVDIDLDFLPVLQQALAARGLTYSVGAAQRNIDANPMPGIRLVDHDVILVDERVQVVAALGRHFSANIGTVAPGVDLIRGWVGVEAVIEGQPVTVINTHLESGRQAELSGLRALQAMELAASIGEARNVIIMGDLNDHPGSPMYQVLQGAGFTDAWAALRPEAGFTCCHAADLSNEREAMSQRIDYVLTRGFETGNRDVKGQIELLGEQQQDRTAGPAYPVWPSDHAGLVARVRPT